MSKKPKIHFKEVLLILIDIAIVVISHIVTMIFLGVPHVNLSREFLELLLAASLYSLSFISFRTYRSLIIFEGIRDYAKHALAAGIACFLMIAISSIFDFHHITSQVATLGGFVTAAVIIMSRLTYKLLIFSNRSGDKKAERTPQNVLIIGGGYGAREIINTIRASQSQNEKYQIVGIIDDDYTKAYRYIAGVKVIGNRSSIPEIVKQYNVDLIFFAIYNINPVERRKILEICQDTNVKVRTLPTTKEMIDRQGAMTSLRDIKIEDLLSRDPIKLNNQEIGSLIKDQVVLVAGGGGSIGSELCRQIIKYHPKTLVIVDIYENNLYDIQLELMNDYPKADIVALVASIRDKARMDNIFKTYKPTTVFHAAAHKHVPLMENSPLEAIKNNVFGTYNVVNCADKYNVKRFVLISSDKAVNPTNVMGASKRVCEMIVQAKNKVSKTDYVAVRFGNVLGSNGSVIPLFRKQIERGGPVTVVHREIIRYFMTIPEAVQLILQAATYAKGGEVFVLDMGEPVKIYDLAVRMIKMMGYEPNKDIHIEITGLRPGEKLYEELLTADEGLVETKHEKIFVIDPGSPSMPQLEKNLAKLNKLLEDEKDDRNAVRKTLKEIVPTFRDPSEANKQAQK